MGGLLKQRGAGGKGVGDKGVGFEVPRLKLEVRV